MSRHTIDPPTIDRALDALEVAADLLRAADLDDTPARELQTVRRLEVVLRRIGHGADRAAGHLDVSAAFSLGGHANARSALKHLGRLAGRESLGRVQTARALRDLPRVDAAYAAGRIPTGHVRAIARAAANPRVCDALTIADPGFVDQASELSRAVPPGRPTTTRCPRRDHRHRRQRSVPRHAQAHQRTRVPTRPRPRRNLDHPPPRRHRTEHPVGLSSRQPRICEGSGSAAPAGT
ncbi:MAG: hypothetical protein OSA99_09975 [Acidimicrobiales bacterium]|nr:hypothetical protein [Acidimicrobiales bacterium]